MATLLGLALAVLAEVKNPKLYDENEVDSAILTASGSGLASPVHPGRNAPSHAEETL